MPSPIPNNLSQAVVVNSSGAERTIVSAGSANPIPPQFRKIVIVNSSGVEQTVGS